MNIQQKQFTKFIKLMSDNNCLQHVILVGSWAEYIYEQAEMQLSTFFRILIMPVFKKSKTL